MAAMWAYNFDDAARSASLATIPRFDYVVARILGDMRIVCRHRRDCDDMTGFRRAEFCIVVAAATFDAFFNAENGYRGAYFRSPYDGLAANDALLSALRPQLIAWHPDADSTFDAESLTTPSAKAWVTEAGNEYRGCSACVGEWKHPQDDTAEIRNNRWEVVSDRRGRKAPRYTKIKVFGAFIDNRSNEFVPWRKRHRSWDIHKSGWA